MTGEPPPRSAPPAPLTAKAPPPAHAAAQRDVLRGMAVGMAVTLVLLAIGFHQALPMPLETRVTTLGIALLALGLWVAAAIGAVARARFRSAAAIDGQDGADPRVDTGNAILRNTIEQAVLAAIAYTALTVLNDEARVPVALFAACFSAGRVLFWIGYREGAGARALGFALTFYPSLAALVAAAMPLLR